MINQEKVVLMTRLASYEANEGKKYLEIGRYFKSDYISLQLLKSLISGTIVFVILAGLSVLYDIESFMKNFYQTSDLINLIKEMAIVYLILMGIYLIFTYVFAIYRYNRSRQSLRTYYNNLKKLLKFYE